jgi:tetratricopeptide (TPR) repeat protein
MRSTEPLPNSNPALSKKIRLYTLALAGVILGLLFWAYANHFDNEFEFDDDHTIVRNSAIDTMDIGAFMTDPATYSTLPANQAWRPGVTILNCIDTIMSKDRVPDQFVFHVHIFISYILLGILIFFMLLWFVRKIFPDLLWAPVAALLATGFYMLHTANAETINYIISRSDTQSTLFIVLSIVMFQYSELSRKYCLFLIPMAVGFLIKETSLMVAPFLIFFCWLFTDGLKKYVLRIAIAFVVAAVLYMISAKFTPEGWTSGGNGRWFLYLCTQAFVIVHYFFTFVLPMNLSADTDWTYVDSPFDTRVMAGALFIGTAIYLAIRWSQKDETKLASFGIFWFFIALAPTSSVFPFAEVMNDHRIFFPFIGLTMVTLNFAILLFKRVEATQNQLIKIASIVVVAGVLIGHSVGTRQRCEVWNDGESLWKDVTEKSPGNPRGWMNYGLAMMKYGADTALPYLKKTVELTPMYSYAHVNLGVAYDRLKNDAAARSEYETAMLCDSTNPEVLYFYGEWKLRHNEVADGLKLLRNACAKSPNHASATALLAAWSGHENVQSTLQFALETADENPTAENLLTLSLEWYKAGEYLQCALTAEKAAALKPDYQPAYNNICAGYNKIGEFDKAVEAGRTAISLNPNDELGKGNYNFAVAEQARFNSLNDDAVKSNDHDKWINLSLEWYKVSNFRKSLEAAQNAVKIRSEDATGYNNICAAANRLGEFDIAIEAGEKAIQLKPDWELAKNNLEEAKRLKGKK